MTDPRAFASSVSNFLLFLLVSSATSQPPPSTSNSSYYYNLCAPSRCGNLTLPYPFTLPTHCNNPANVQPLCPSNTSLHLTSPRSTDTFTVLSLTFPAPNTTALTVAAASLFTCPSRVSHPNYSADVSTFMLSPLYTYGTHLNCSSPLPDDAFQGLQNASCLGCEGQDVSRFCYYAPWFVSQGGCETFYIYTLGDAFNASAHPDLRGYLQSGFELRYDKPMQCLQCEDSGGRCGTNPSSSNGEFVCFCTSGIHSSNCSDGMVGNGSRRRGSGGPSRAVIAAISAPATVVLFAFMVALVGILVFRRNRTNHFNKDTFSGISPTRYSYSELKKFTNNFTSKLGEGGFGCVYKGAIQQSGVEVLVAVKILKMSKQTEKHFMNEIATIGSVHHHNLVGMLGYCVDRNRHGLVYEFMENGSLDEYIFNQNGNNRKMLSTEQLYNVALGTARGILYLHEGCRDRILHCDIKPPNVLLDANFSAKVADFGLARMIDKDHSHISLKAAQGTPGYAPPEMWLKNFASVTVKSDVYGYGMLLLEMVGRRKNYSPEVADPSQVYFPEWLYNKMVKDEFLNTSTGDDSCVGIEESGYLEEHKLIRCMCLVGLWCVQYIPSNRPSMDRVVQMLEGHTEIGLPPHPFPEKISRSHETTHQESPM